MRIVNYSDKHAEEILSPILSRQLVFSGEEEKTVRYIIETVRKEGDDALVRFVAEFDGVSLRPDEFRIPEEKLKESHNSVDRSFLSAFRSARKNIERFHRAQKRESYTIDDGDGVSLGLRYTPVEKVGLYVPGGKAAYPSSILMNAIPAQIAGVERIVVVTPPGRFFDNPHVGAALREMELTEVYGIGGAHAVAALAFGTRTIPKVDKIVGPGNIYVALAKKIVYGIVDIDMIAGPSEIVILADSVTNPAYVAADLLSQAEHGSGQELVILITDSRKLAQKVEQEITSQTKTLRHACAIKTVLEKSVSIVVDKLEDGIDAVNSIAPEHLELMVAEPQQILDKIRNAGAIFLGSDSPEPVSDYFAGPNHVLPTNGTARFHSPLGVYDFQKCSTVVSYSHKRLIECGQDIIKLAEVEGFDAHANAIRIRMEK